jgi:hypothetical protein
MNECTYIYTYRKGRIPYNNMCVYTYTRGKDKTITLHREKSFEKYIILRRKFQDVMMSCVFWKSPTEPKKEKKYIIYV